LLDSATELEYSSYLVQFCKHKGEALKYIKGTWLTPWKEKLVRFWVNQNLHFSVCVTSLIKGCYAVLKAYLRVSTSNLKGVFDKLLLYWLMQHQAILDTAIAKQNRVLHWLSKRYFDLVQSLVYDRALLLIVREQAKLHKAEDKANMDWPCRCTIQQTIGILCYHDLFERLKDGGQVLPRDIHPFWWYDKSKVSIILGNTNSNTREIIIEPAVVKGKGRPKGSKNNRPRAKKGGGITSMY